MSGKNFWQETWDKATVREVPPDELTGEFWTGGDGDVIAVVRKMRDGSSYLDHINLRENGEVR